MAEKSGFLSHSSALGRLKNTQMKQDRRELKFINQAMAIKKRHVRAIIRFKTSRNVIHFPRKGHFTEVEIKAGSKARSNLDQSWFENTIDVTDFKCHIPCWAASKMRSFLTTNLVKSLPRNQASNGANIDLLFPL